MGKQKQTTWKRKRKTIFNHMLLKSQDKRTFSSRSRWCHFFDCVIDGIETLLANEYNWLGLAWLRKEAHEGNWSSIERIEAALRDWRILRSFDEIFRY